MESIENIPQPTEINSTPKPDFVRLTKKGKAGSKMAEKKRDAKRTKS